MHLEYGLGDGEVSAETCRQHVDIKHTIYNIDTCMAKKCYRTSETMAL